MPKRTLRNVAQQLSDVVRTLRNQAIDRRISAITGRLGQLELTEAEQAELVREQQALRQRKREPLTQPVPKTEAAVQVQTDPTNDDAEEPPNAPDDHVEEYRASIEGNADEPF